MASNSTCSWPSPAALVADIESLELNTTDLVTQCGANLCHVAFQSNSLVCISLIPF